MFDDLHSIKFHLLGIQTLQHGSCALHRQNRIHLLRSQCSMSPYKKCQHTTVSFFIGLVCKFHSVRFSLDASEMMTEMYKIIVGTSDEMFLSSLEVKNQSVSTLTV